MSCTLKAPHECMRHPQKAKEILIDGAHGLLGKSQL